jgi:hypothetical protein
MQILAPNTILVTTLDLQAMWRVWPCSGLPYYGFCVSFQFDSHGNLDDIEWYTDEGIDCAEPDGIDQTCMAALSTDAQEYLNAYELAQLGVR